MFKSFPVLLVVAVLYGCRHDASTVAAPSPTTAEPSIAGSGAQAPSNAGVGGKAGVGSIVPPLGTAGASTAGGAAGQKAAGAGASVAASGSGGRVGSAGVTAVAGLGAVGGAGGNAGIGANAGSAGQDSRPFPAIAFAGLVSAVELAPVRLAANGIYPARVTIGSGGVDNLFSAGAALVASNAETQALRASVQHPNLRIIFTICEGLYRIVAKRSAGIQTLADLRGKRISLPLGTSSNYFLVKMLATANLTEQDVIEVSGMPGMGAVTTDAATIWEPGIQYVSDTLKDDAIEFQKDAQGLEVYRELFNLHATAESLSDPSKRRGIVEFVRSLITASHQIQSDPSKAISLMTAPTGASQAVLERSWKYERFAGSLVGDLLDVLEQEETWRAKIDGRTPRARAELASLIDDSIVKEANGM